MTTDAAARSVGPRLVVRGSGEVETETWRRIAGTVTGGAGATSAVARIAGSGIAGPMRIGE